MRVLPSVIRPPGQGGERRTGQRDDGTTGQRDNGTTGQRCRIPKGSASANRPPPAQGRRGQPPRHPPQARKRRVLPDTKRRPARDGRASLAGVRRLSELIGEAQGDVLPGLMFRGLHAAVEAEGDVVLFQFQPDRAVKGRRVYESGCARCRKRPRRTRAPGCGPSCLPLRAPRKGPRAA